MKKYLLTAALIVGFATGSTSDPCDVTQLPPSKRAEIR
jgi:hypothetical protein